MPGLNQRGPMGQGPMTGRRMGRCIDGGADLKETEATPHNNQNENSAGNFPGRGFGFGWRGGRSGRRGRGMGQQNRHRGGF